MAKEQFKQKNTFWRNWGAVFILLVFFAASWAGQLFTQLSAVRQEAETHGQEFRMSEFWPQFWSATFENWQSEWLQLTTQAVLISGFAAYIFRKQDEEHFKTQSMIDELKKEVKALKVRRFPICVGFCHIIREECWLKQVESFIVEPWQD